MGSCTAGGAYVPAMSDETIIVKNQGTIFLGGPPLVKAATGEVVTRRGAGRRRRAHAACRASPTTSPRTTRTRWRSRARIVANLNRAKRPSRELAASRSEPLYDPGGALRRRSRPTCASPTTCARSSPASSTAREFDEFKARYGTTLVSGFARI